MAMAREELNVVTFGSSCGRATHGSSPEVDKPLSGRRSATSPSTQTSKVTSYSLHIASGSCRIPEQLPASAHLYTSLFNKARHGHGLMTIR